MSDVCLCWSVCVLFVYCAHAQNRICIHTHKTAHSFEYRSLYWHTNTHINTFACNNRRLIKALQTRLNDFISNINKMIKFFVESIWSDIMQSLLRICVLLIKVIARWKGKHWFGEYSWSVCINSAQDRFVYALPRMNSTLRKESAAMHLTMRMQKKMVAAEETKRIGCWMVIL